MITATTPALPSIHLLDDIPPPSRSPRPELAWRALEQVDFGMALVDGEGVLQHANHLARDEICRGRLLRMQDGRVTCPHPAQAEKLGGGLRLAAAGRRQMLVLHDDAETLAVACVPLEDVPGPHSPGPVLLTLGRRADSQRLAITFFARSYGLTPAEEKVLRSLCAGLSVRAISQVNGVTEGTVRTQVRTLRDKAGARSIRVLLQQIAALPPVPALSLATTRAAALLRAA